MIIDSLSLVGLVIGGALILLVLGICKLTCCSCST